MNCRPIPCRISVAACVVPLALLGAPGAALAAGTDAGREIRTSAQATFAIGGVPQSPVASNAVQTFVDELLDVVVISIDSGPIGVASPTAGAVSQFTVTNTGNGAERFRLAVDDGVTGDDFDPSLVQIHYESNAVPGLQTGVGGDTVYVAGGNEPLLAEDELLTVYVEAAIPGSQSQNAEGALTLRAVAVTVFDNAGTDDPADAGFPAPGTAYPGAGDPDETGTGNVTAVVGATHDPLDLLLVDEGRYRVSAAVVAISKTATAISDPFGGATLVPGSVVSYRIEVNVSGSGTAENLAVSDVIPAELEYRPGTLSVSALPPGEEADDDFTPTGTDNTGFNVGTQTINVSLGSLAGGATVIVTFDTAIR